MTGRKEYEATQAEAMRLVSLLGIEWIDSLLSTSNETDPGQEAKRAKVLAALYSLLEVRADVSRETARRHIARALRRQRHPNWRDPAEGWGGKRPGAFGE